MFCNNCGKPNPDDATFCSKCGAKLNDLGDNSKDNTIINMFNSLDKKKQKWLYVYIVYFLVVFIISMDSCNKYEFQMASFIGYILLYGILIPIIIWGIYYWYQQNNTNSGKKNGKEKVFWEEFTKNCPNDAMQIRELVGDDFYNYTYKDGMYRINSIRYAASETFHCEIKELKDLYLKLLKIKLEKDPLLDLAKEKHELELSKLLYERGTFVIKTPWEYSFYSLCLMWAEEYLATDVK